MSDPTLRQDFVDAMSQAAATVCIVTTDGIAGRSGVTVSAMSSISADGPAPTMLVCVNDSSRTAAPLLENGVFVINVLEAGQQHLADVFASRIDPPGGDKFNVTGTKTLATGAPVLDDVLVAFDCRLQSAQKVGTHHVVIGAVEAVHRRGTGAPLVYGMRSYLRAEPA